MGSNLPDIDRVFENDISGSPDKDQEQPYDVPNKSNDCDKVRKYGLRRNIKPPQKLDYPWKYYTMT